MKSLILVGMLLTFTEEQSVQDAWVVLDQRCHAMSGWPLKNIVNFYQCYSHDGKLLFEERIDPATRIA